MVRINSEAAIVGRAYEKPKELVAKYSKENKPLLFLGETGSGKELFANLYMKISDRDGESRTVNCAEFTKDETLRSEVFGHVRGAYTGAYENRPGLIKTCEDGILFLDELDSASPEFQATILRVAEQNSYRKLGSDDEKECKALFIAATKSLTPTRIDIKYRFNIIPIPSLQPFDIPEIAEKHLGKRLKEETLDMLVKRDYHGNVRELIKLCDKLKIEKGEKIFSKKTKKRPYEWDHFDYDEFRREIELWHKHIQPIIDRYDLVGIKYKYKKPVGTDNDFSEKFCRLFDVEKFNIIDIAGSTSGLKHGILHFSLGDGDWHTKESIPEAALGVFSKVLRVIIEQGRLQEIFKVLEDEENIIKDIPKSNIERKSNLTRLLDITPSDKAEKKFKQLYANYNLEKNNGNKSTTSEELGISVKTLNRYLKE